MLRTIVLSMFSLVIFTIGCGMFGPSDEKLVRQTVVKWKTALEKKDIDKMMENYSEDYRSERGQDKASVRSFMENLKEQGYLDNLKTNLEDVKINIEGNAATAGTVRITGEFIDADEFRIDWTLKKDKDKVWRFVDSRME